MSTMIDRLGLAIADNYLKDYDIRSVSKFARDSMAEAAINVLRHPTAEMLAAGISRSEGLNEAQVYNIWQAMVDEAGK